MALPPIDSGGRGMFYRQTRGLPLRIALFKPEGLETALAQLRDRLVGEDAICSPAVGHDFLIAGQFPESALEFAQRHIERARQMTGGEFFCRTGIDYGNNSLPHAPQEFLA